MTTLDEALVEITATVAALEYTDGEGGNIRATPDPALLNPPGVWVQVGEIEHSLANGALVVEFHLWLVASTSDTVQAWRQIDRMRAAVVGQGGALFWPDNPASPLPLQLPGDSKPLPALRLTIRTRVE